ncbi:MAG: acyl-CoA dehydrogenase [Burkholderiales bacterium]|nr:MAG: acyl-CoA dehydrogenase [Burkholderiales bacterium]
MDFDFSPEQKQLKDQVRRYLGDRCDSGAVRAILDGPEPYDRALWRGLGELGYLGASIPESDGGLGLGHLEACVIAEELGRAVAPVPWDSSIAQVAECLVEAGSDVQRSRWLPRLAAGEAVGAVALAERTGRVTAASIRCTARAASDGGVVLDGTKLAVADGDVADVAVVAALDAPGSVSLYLVALEGPGIVRTPVQTLDPTRSHATLVFDGAHAQRLGAPGQGLEILERVLDRAAVLVAFAQLGGADRALESAVAYAQGRFAFGRPIGSLQAIKHLLADMYVSATLARSNCYWAAWALSTGSSELPVAAASARVAATQAYQQCARDGLQVHGGMGFTWALDCHLHYRRSNLLALSLGALSQWEDRLVGLLREGVAA